MKYLVLSFCTLLFATPAIAQLNNLEQWDESAYVGDGVVEWRVYIRNNGDSRVCCTVDLEGTRFSYGDRDIVRDRRQMCVYPGRESYVGLTGVTTELGTSTRWGDSIFADGPSTNDFNRKIPWKSPSDVASNEGGGRHGYTKYRVYACRWGNQ